MSSLIERAMTEGHRFSSTRGRREDTVRATVSPDLAPASIVRRASRPLEWDAERLRRHYIVSPDASSPLANEMRAIKRRLLRHAFVSPGASGPRRNLVMVTSACPGEGKTFTALNLAMSVSADHALTALVVDLDVSGRALSRLLGLGNEPGLVELLADGAHISDVLHRHQATRIAVLPAGRPDPLASELLTSARMIALLAELGSRYPDRVVILDAPPVLHSSDPSALAHHVGQIALVVEAERTDLMDVGRAVHELGTVGARIGFILNKTRRASRPSLLAGIGHAAAGSRGLPADRAVTSMRDGDG